MTSSYQSIKDRLGELLDTAYVFVHCFEGSINGLISYKLIFGSNNFVVIGLGPDGDSLKISVDDLKGSDLGEYGTTRLLSAAEYDPATINACVGRRFDRCRLKADASKIYAVEFHFEGIIISFSNIDDEMAFGVSLESLDVGNPVQLIELSHQG